jgi:hypothetical protein
MIDASLAIIIIHLKVPFAVLLAALFLKDKPDSVFLECSNPAITQEPLPNHLDILITLKGKCCIFSFKIFNGPSLKSSFTKISP